MEEVVGHVTNLMTEIQENIYKKAFTFRKERTTSVDNFDQFKEVLDTTGGFVMAHWDGTTETEEKIKDETKATIRCIPLDQKEEEGVCVYSGQPSRGRVIFARAY